MNEYFDTCRICPNGHLLTDTARTNWPLYNDDFCKTCGEKLIQSCPACRKDIKGALVRDHEVAGREVFPGGPIPAYCWNCGKPYPWTAKFLAAAREIIGQIEELTESEKQEFAESLDDAVRQTPNRVRSAERMKHLWRKLKKPSQDLLNNLAANGIYDFLKGLFS